jgi:adenosylcobinamide kinase/adenosylcobinamide-phosphate guanylyltransferase
VAEVRVQLLGTAAAGGWPNPFCECASCATLRRAGETRGQTAALVDDVLMLDCGPDAGRTATRLGRSLSAVRHLLVTHAHHDHLEPAALLWRSWAERSEPLDLVGPPEVVDTVRDWLAPSDPVRLRPVQPGDELRLGGHQVRVLGAAHDVPTVLYDVTGPDGDRLLYATDTGPLPVGTLDATAGAAFDVVLLEETWGDVVDHHTGHHDLATFPATLRSLRGSGAITEVTDVVAVHLGHHNPPTDELSRRLAQWGARVVPDGAVLTGPGRVGASPAARVAPHRTLVLGGARSGKSVEAERRLAAEPRVTYVATARPDPQDAEWTARLQEHRSRRPAGWTTVESHDVAAVLRDSSDPVLVDCLSLWLADALERGDHRKRVDELVASWRGTRARVVAVSNEVGSGVVPASESGRTFRDELGRLNAMVAAESDDVLLMVAGRATRL